MCITTDEKLHSDKTHGRSSSLHVLLLDDEKAVLDALSRLLRAQGHQCSTALTGEILIDTLEHGRQNSIRYDLAILDINIVGGMGGIETMHQVAGLWLIWKSHFVPSTFPLR